MTTDDRVVRRLAEHFANPNDDGSEGEAGDENHVILARAYLAMTAERDSALAERDQAKAETIEQARLAVSHYKKCAELRAQLTASEAARGRLSSAHP